MGTGPSVLTSHEILRQVSLYYLSRSTLSSAYTYAHNIGFYFPEYKKANTDAPLLFSNFRWNVAFWPEKLVQEVGNLVYYECKLKGRY
jgi:hypothetical protein